jgi:predicted DNA-binding protein (MmcQ/YjbR family)
MNLDALRAYCLSRPQCAEKVQWEDHLLFTIGGKMFVITSFEPGPFVATLKPDPERRLELLETEGVEPAPYLARAGWISVRQWETLRDPEWRDLISESYRMILAKLPKKLQATIAGTAAHPSSKPGAGKPDAAKRSSAKPGAATAAKKARGKSAGLKVQSRSADSRRSRKITPATVSSHKRSGRTKRVGKSAGSGSR